MYYYIVDPGKIAQRDFERVLNQLYSSVSNYRVTGEIMRATSLRTIPQLVESAFSRGAKSIVAVGSDDTLQEIISAVGSREIVMGFVPISDDSPLGEILGVKGIEQAAKTLGARRIEEFDVGSINNNLFFSKLTFGLPEIPSGGWLGSLSYGKLQKLFQLPEFEIKFSVDSQYQASLKIICGMLVNNRNDGSMDLFLIQKLPNWDSFKFRHELMAGELEKIPGSSIIHLKKLEIRAPDGLILRTKGKVLGKTPAIIEVKPGALKIIVGKDRKF